MKELLRLLQLKQLRTSVYHPQTDGWPAFAMLASPLNDLTRKTLTDRITWSEAANQAFGTLREALCSEPVLITPDFAFPLIVHTDASEVGYVHMYICTYICTYVHTLGV